MPFPLFAHAGEPLAPHDLWAAWNGEPFVLLPLLLTALLYVAGVIRLWRRAGIGRGVSAADCLRFAAAWLALAVALVSPLDALSGSLFSAHMAQHLVLSLVAAPLLVASNLPLALLWALPRPLAHSLGRGLNRAPGLQRAGSALTHPFAAWLLFALSLWLWHAPRFYEAALNNDAIHALEHLTLLAAAALFWWALLRRDRAGQLRYALAVPYLFTATLHSGVLGALMMFTSRPWYAYYAERTAAWGLTPLEDQQLAGLIMWVPGGMIFTLLAVAAFAAWLRNLEQRHAS